MTLFRHILLACLALLFLGSINEASASVLPRKIIALYDSRAHRTPGLSPLHKFLEMPANHLGFILEYHDVTKPLPALDASVHGVALWFNRGTELSDPGQLLDWIDQGLDAGKKLLIIEEHGLGGRHTDDPAYLQKLNHVLGKIGIHYANRWHDVTYQSRVVYRDSSMVEFERLFESVLPPFEDIQARPPARSHLQLLHLPSDESPSDLVITGPGGGMIAEGYATFHAKEDETETIHQWYVNPFLFLRLALGSDDFPKPDVTTWAGRRIFYGHIDGDGWNNISEIAHYNKSKAISAEVIRKEILEAYSDFAFNVGVITGDIDQHCYGLPDSERAARAILALPNVAASSHTHSHPLFWRFFEEYTPDKEQPFLDLYPPKPRRTFLPTVKNFLFGDPGKDAWGEHSHAHTGMPEGEEGMPEKYETPRSYACSPFDLDQEISGAVQAINRLAPPGKEAKLIQWSGNTNPFEAALAKTHEAGLLNINGGDSRFDSEYPSYASVAPIGLQIGAYRQIYSSNSNENTYTNLWTDRFFGFRYLQTTVQNTESPLRIRPFNVYFHMYSGQKQASLNAVKENLNFARQQPVLPMTATDYASIATGFYTTELEDLGDKRWKIRQRGALQTIRFDHATLSSVDFERSKGVIGQKHFQGSLYVMLNPEESEPILALQRLEAVGDYPIASVPYLMDSRWMITKYLLFNKDNLTVHAQGYGRGSMRWKMSAPGTYRVQVIKNGATLLDVRMNASADGVLDIDFGDLVAIDPVEVSISAE